MNRAQRRAQAAREKMQHNAERVHRIVEAKLTVEEELGRFRALLFAIARKDGRVVARADDLKALGENDRIDFVMRDNGDVVVEYTAGQ